MGKSNHEMGPLMLPSHGRNFTFRNERGSSQMSAASLFLDVSIRNDGMWERSCLSSENQLPVFRVWPSWADWCVLVLFEVDPRGGKSCRFLFVFFGRFSFRFGNQKKCDITQRVKTRSSWSINKFTFIVLIFHLTLYNTITSHQPDVLSANSSTPVHCLLAHR